MLVPCQPNALNVWASAPTLELAEGASTDALLVLNRVPPRGRAAEQMRDEIAAQRWPLAGALLGNRQAYGSLDRGRARGRRRPRPGALQARRSPPWPTR